MQRGAFKRHVHDLPVVQGRTYRPRIDGAGGSISGSCHVDLSYTGRTVQGCELGFKVGLGCRSPSRRHRCTSRTSTQTDVTHT